MLALRKMRGLHWVVCAVLLAFIACQKPDAKRLVIGMELNYPPFEMIDAASNPAGVSVDMARALGESMGRNVKIENIPFDGLVPALKTGKIDLIISSMTATPERAQSIDFSDPYLSTGLCLLVNKQAGIHNVTEADAPGVAIAVKQGTTGQIYAQGHFQKARILVLDKEDACVLEVVQNKAQAFIFDQMSIYKHWQRHREKTEALLRPFQEEHWAIGIRRGNDLLKSQVNSFLTAFKKDGGFEKLADKYLKDEKDAFREMGIPFYF